MKERETVPALALLAGEHVTQEEAAGLVRESLKRQGKEVWRDMEVELYPGEGESLVIARRREEVCSNSTAAWVSPSRPAALIRGARE